MHEGSKRRFEYSLASNDRAQVAALAEFIGDTAFNPNVSVQINDPVEEAFLKSIYHKLQEDEALISCVADAAVNRRLMGSHFPLPYRSRLLELAFDKQMKRLFPESYPHDFGTLSSWDKAYPSISLEEVHVDMSFRSQAYNNQTTYGFYDLEIRRFQNRWDRPPVVVDVGGSLGQASKKLILQKKYPYAPMDPLVGLPDKDGDIVVTDKDLASQFEELRRGQPPIGGIVSLDIFNPKDDPGLPEWIYGNTFPMSQEIRFPDAVDEYNRLMAEPGVTDRLIDPLDPQLQDTKDATQNILVPQKSINALDPSSLLALADMLPDGKADFFIFSGVIMQWTPEQTAQVFYNFLPYCSENALYSINEWASVDPSSPSGLRIAQGKYWQIFGGFGNFLKNPHKLNSPPIAMGYFPNRRCQEIALTNAGRAIMQA